MNSLWQRLRLLAGRGHAEAPVRAVTGNRVADSLRGLLDDPSIPPGVRAEMAADFQRIEQMLAKLERGELHVAVFGRVSAGNAHR